MYNTQIMKKLLITSMSVAVISMSSMTWGMGSDAQQNEAAIDALNALQLTNCSVYTDLQANMQSGFYSLSAPDTEGFGIDDIESYAQKSKTTLSRLGVEG